MNIEKYWSEIIRLYPDLHEIMNPPPTRRMTSGRLHQTYKLQTNIGNFALKILDPWIVSQYGAGHWNNCEKIAEHFAQEKIPTIIAIKNRDGNYVSKINDIYFLIYPWVEGEVLESEGITIKHAERIGELLGRIHLSSCHPKQREGSPSKAHELLMEIPRFTRDDNCILSHRDLDPRNIIWQHDQPVIIDWEYTGLIGPTLDLLLVAFNIAGLSQGKIPNKKLFQAVLNGYKKTTGKLPKFTQQDYLQYISYCLDWVEFNRHRWEAEPEKKTEIQQEIAKSQNAIEWIDKNITDFIKSLY